MKISDAGVDLIKEFEGLELTAYYCPAGVLTIGYGHILDVEEGQTITEDEAEVLLRSDLKKFERCVNSYLAVTVTQSQFDALVSFAFNLGCDALRKSTLLRMLNEGDDIGASQQFVRWNKANGKQLAGLTRRREAERDLFLA